MLKTESKNLAVSILLFFALVLTTTKALAEDAVSEPATASPKTLFGDYLKEKGIEITPSATLDFYDKYVWRGQYLDTDPVVQPGISFSSYGATIGYWGSLPMGSTSDTLDSAESDYYVSYAYTFKPVTISAGHTWYEFSGASTSSKEFFVSISAAMLLTPTFAFYHDYEDGSDLNSDEDGNYYSFGISHSFPVWESVSVDLAATYGIIDGQWLNGEGSHFTPTIGLKVPLTSNLTIIPTIGYNVTMGDLEDENIANQESKFFGGVKSSMTF